MEITCSKDLGTLIQTKRKKMNISQKQAAALCNVGTRFLSDLENGKPTLQIDKVLFVCKMFGIKIKVD